MPAGLQDLFGTVLDDDSFVSWDEPPSYASPSADYRAELARARERSGVDEAVQTGEGRISGRRVAVIGCEFGFLAGSIGGAAAERLCRSIHRATAEGLPLLAAPASGGTRMQEGTVAFVQMLRITQAIQAHKRRHLPYLVYLRHPTTGGVLASWGSLGHVTVAEPDALIGFLGPRVYEALQGQPFPEGVQRAENLLRHGLVDAVQPREAVAGIAHRALQILMPAEGRTSERPAADVDADPDLDVDAWDAVTRSRDPRRPGVRELLRQAADDVVRLQGTGQGEADPTLLLALARVGGVSVVVLGQDRRTQTSEKPMGPAALREARRGMRLASELALPLLTVIDTPGAALSRQAEEGGLAGEIARCLSDQLELDVPVLALLLGQGTGGGALALMPADRLVAAQHAWLSPLPPEGASAIVHRDLDHAAELARSQGVAATTLRRVGVVDRVVAERPDAAAEPEAFCRRIVACVAEELGALARLDPADRRHRRWQRHEALGPALDTTL